MVTAAPNGRRRPMTLDLASRPVSCLCLPHAAAAAHPITHSTTHPPPPYTTRLEGEAARSAASSCSMSAGAPGGAARDLGVYLLSLLITLVGRVYRRLSSFLHRSRFLLSGGATGGCSCAARSTTTTSGTTSTSRAPARVDQHTMLPSLPNIQRLSPRVVRVLGLNPGAHTLQGTCTYLLGTGKRRILVDTGEGRPGYPALLAEALKMAGAEEGIEAVLLTHHHYDHVGGLAQVRSAYGGAALPVYKRLDENSSGGSGSEGGLRPIEDGDVFRTEGATLRALLTPGHTKDHVSFWLEEEEALLSGDCVLGHGTTVFDDLYTYMASLRRLLRLARGQEEIVPSTTTPPPPAPSSSSNSSRLRCIYPGHGAAIDDAKDGQGTAVGVIESYIMHRELRERQILGLLIQERDEGKGKGLSPLHIVQRIYERLPAQVVMSAQWNVEHHLEKLSKEGKAASSGLGLWRATAHAAMDS